MSGSVLDDEQVFRNERKLPPQKNPGSYGWCRGMSVTPGFE